MSKMVIFDPATCCSTGVCGPSVDPELLRVAAVIESLKKSGIEVARHNLSSEPQVFMRSKAVSDALNERGVDALPITTLDGKIAKSGSYPTNEEFTRLLGVSVEATKPAKAKLTIEWQHLDVEGETCNRCYDTGENLAAEIKRLNRALSPQNIKIEYIDTELDGTHISDSNTLLFNDVPIEDILNIEVSQSYCASCSDLLGTKTYCRTIKFDGNEYEDIPAKAIRQAAYKALNLNEDSSDTSESSGCCCDGGCSCC